MDEDQRLDSPLTRLKYIGPFLAERFQTHSFWPPEGRGSQLVPLTSLRELLTFVKARRGPHTKRNLSSWLRAITTNERAGECLDSRPIETCVHYRVRPQNLFGHTMILNFLREFLPPAHRNKIPLRQHHPTTGPYQSHCCPVGPRRPNRTLPPRTVQWSS